MTAGDLSACHIVGGHRPPLQFVSQRQAVL